MQIRIKATDSRYSGGPSGAANIAYIHGSAEGGYRCTLANGTPAAFSYAGISGDAMACKFALSDAGDDPQAALAAVQAMGSRFYVYELTGTPTAQPAGLIAGQVATALWRAKAAKEITAAKAPKKMQPILDGIKWAAFSIACELRGADPEFDPAGFMAAAGYRGEF